MVDDDDEIDRLLRRLDILHEGLSPEIRDEIRRFFDDYGSLLVEPYRQKTFDFGDPAFRERLHASFQDASELREVVGSPHFIFLNKALVGLLNLLTQLKPRIDTTESLDRLNEALDEMGHSPVPA
jgi:hypothetical protein